MKKKLFFPDILWSGVKNLFLVMKLTTFLVFLSAITLAASSYSQSTRFNLNVENANIIQVFDEIERLTEFGFLFKTDQLDVKKLYTLEIEDADIDKVMDELLDNELYKYRFIDRTIVITKTGLDNFQIENAIKVTGKITSTIGEPIPGATVVVNGTTQGTITNSDGGYSLSNVPENGTLVFSFVGMKTKTADVNGKSQIDIILEEESIGLDEVIAIGYGMVKKSDLTGSVSSLKGDDLNTGSNSSIEQALQGRSAGVQVIQSSSEPGGGMAIRIRGAGSVNAGSSPLYVIDGLPIDNSLVIDGTGPGVVGTRTPRNPLSSINPADIESIEILKDASATAIYGARGANGVIIVTTKKGKEGRLNITYSGYSGLQTPANQIELLKPQEYMTALNGILEDGGGNPEERVTGVQGSGTNWQDEVTRDAVVQSHSISLSGGNNSTNYFASLNYFNQEGVVINSAFKRYDARMNLDHSINKFHFGINFTTSHSHDDYVTYGYGINEDAGSLYAALNFDPSIEIYNGDGTYQTSSYITIDNPLALANDERSSANNYRTMGTIFGEYSILPEWKVKLNLGVDVQNSRRDFYVGRETKEGAGAGGIGTVRVGTSSNYLVEGTTTYNLEINEKHNLNFMSGVTFQNFNLDRFSGSGRNFPTEVTKTNSMGAADPTLYSMGSFKSNYKLFSVIGRINYSLLQNYLFTATFRGDGSSRFGENNKFGYFPSFAFAWKLHQEEFIKNLDLFSQLKFRASWGKTGNQSIGNYQSLTTFAGGPTAILDEQKVTTLDPSRIGNMDLKWETTDQTNFGFDMGFLENRIFATADYFEKKTSDMLLHLPIPSSSGFGSILQNVGSIKNTGFEFMIDSKNLVGKFKWSTSLNFSRIKNVVTDLGSVSEIIHESAGWSNQIAVIREGETLNSFYGYNVLGVWQQDDDFSVTTDPVAPGDLKYQDTNGDGAVNAEDRVILGNSFPDYMWGIANNFSFKGFSLNVFFEGVEGLSMLNNNLVDSYFPINFRRNKYAEPYLNRWTPENPSNKYPSFVNPNGQGNKAVNSYTVEDASYIRLKTVKLSYNFNLKNRKVFKNAVVYVTGQNLFTFTNYSGLDPANNSNGNPSLKIDYNSYPVAKTFMVGVELGL